jgi:homoserine dehydrogenase
MRLLFIGFGTVAQGLSELLLEKRDWLIGDCGLDWRVTGIADPVKGSAYDPAGVDLERALAAAAEGRSIAAPGRRLRLGRARDDRRAEADAVVEVTPPTSRPASRPPTTSARPSGGPPRGDDQQGPTGAPLRASWPSSWRG